MAKPLKTVWTIIFGILLTLIIPLNSQAGSSSKSKNNLWTASFNGGIAHLTSEFTNDFQFLEKEFQHNPGWTFNVNIGRTFGKHWEPGIAIGVYKLSGTSQIPDFTANGIHGSFKNIFRNYPVDYDNISGSLLFYMRYYFREFSNQNNKGLRFDPYAEIGGGMNVFSTELYYQTTPPGMDRPIIFQKSGINKGNVGQMTFALGTQAGFGNKLKLTFAVNADVVNYACLDGVHNYPEITGNESLQDVQKLDAKTIVSRFTAGLIIPLGAAKGGGGSSGNDYSPWSP